jgi:transposase
MLNCPLNTKILLCTQPVDMRKSFDGLCGVVQERLSLDVRSGYLFLFINRRGDRLKALWWDVDSCVIWYRRLESGTFELPKSAAKEPHVTIDATQLAMLIGGVALRAAQRRRKRYRVPA